MREPVLRPSIDEFESFQHFLERSYGHSRGFFVRHFPHLNRKDAKALECSLIMKQNDAIVSHVGAYPLTIVARGARIQTGGIGGVATLPQSRGQGHMSRLMRAALGHMKDRGDVLAVLWGDQQRYRYYGYERCGFKWNVSLSQRSLERAGIKGVEVAEVDPCDADVVEKVRKFHSQQHFRVERPWWHLLLKKDGLRLFLAEEGYVILRGERRDLRVDEVVSPQGKEAELLAGVVSYVSSPGASIDVMPHEGPGIVRLIEAAAHWSVAPQGLFRILDWPGLAAAIHPLLMEKVYDVMPFTIAVKAIDEDSDQTVTFSWDGQSLEIEEGRHCDGVVEYDQRLLVARLLGGPFVGNTPLGPLEKLLPVPLHIPLLDHV